MFKVIIVDDEEEVRKGIINKIDWHKYNFEVAGEAENGREAADLLEDNIPDAVITDITMPVMDGLELAAHIQEHFPTVKTVILTGYNEFSFAQQAIKYAVVDYLLKPVHPNDIDKLMKKLQAGIENEIRQKEDVELLRRHYAESLPILKENFLTLLVTGKPDMAEAERKIARLNIRLKGTRYLCAVICIDHNPQGTMLFHEDIDLVRFAIFNTASEIMQKHMIGEAFILNDNVVIAAGSDIDDKSILINRMFSVMEELRLNIAKYYGATATIGLGRITDRLDRLKESYRTALSALDYKIVLGGNKVIFFEDVEPVRTNSLVFDENREGLLVSKIKFGTEKEVLQAVDALFRDMAATKASLKDIQLYYLEILSCITKVARNLDLETDTLGGEAGELLQLLQSATFEGIRKWFSALCVKLMNQIARKRQNMTQILLKKAEDYIEANFSDNSLSIQKLADHLHISTSYLSLIFKKEAGETFLKYLVRIRLNAAIELLCNSELKTMEIAERVGYPEVTYFSYFFKKHYGMSPREYRNDFSLKRSTEN